MTSDLQPYPELQDSVLPWLGWVPAHWDNLNAPLRPSGMEWLGVIPKHWDPSMARLIRQNVEVCARSGSTSRTYGEPIGLMKVERITPANRHVKAMNH